MKPLTLRVWVPDVAPEFKPENYGRVKVSEVVDYLVGRSWPTELAEKYADDQLSINVLTDEEISKIADGNAEREYYKTVQGFVDDLKSEIKEGNITDADEAREYLEQSIDGCHDVIYTYAAMEVVRISKNDGAYFDHMGSDGAVEDGAIQWSRLAYFALLEDVMEEVGDLDELFREPEEDGDDRDEENE